MFSNIDQLLWRYSFTYKLKSYYRFTYLQCYLQIATNISTLGYVTHISAKTEFHVAKLFDIESVQILYLSMEDAMILKCG